MRKKLIRSATIPMSLDIFCHGLLKELSEDYEVVALSSGGASLDAIASREGVRTIAVEMARPIAPLKDLRALLQLVRVFRREHPDAVHSITPKAGLLCMIAAFLTRVPIRIHTFTGLLFPTAKGWRRYLLKTTDKITCACATHVIAEGQGVRDDLIRHGVTNKPITVLGYGNIRGVNMEYYTPGDDDIQSMGKAIRMETGGEMLFLYVGRLVRDKGVSELIDAFEALHEDNARLLLVGDLSVETDRIDDATVKRIQCNPAIRLVDFQQDVRPWYAAADVLILPSYREGFPNVVLEAGAMGLPCIVTDINGSREIIRDGFNGLIVPSQDAKALEAAMRKMYEDKESRLSMASQARKHIRRHYEQSFVRQCLKDFYRKVIVCLALLLYFGIPVNAQMPRIRVQYNLLSTTTFYPGQLQLIDGTDSISYPIEIRHRGATATLYAKRSYAVKLLNAAGEKCDISLLGMRKDNYWILDAMAVDVARMRNRAGMDLWLEFARKPHYATDNQQVINGYRGRMVEMWVNEEYVGIYCLMERVDRKQLQLNKDELGQHGLLYKPTTWQSTCTMTSAMECPNGSIDAWMGWELKYPDVEDGGTANWQPLCDLVTFTATADDEQFLDVIDSRLDMPVVVDFILFIQLLSARDNQGKNLYYSFYDISSGDRRAVLTPWDLDHSWGRMYNSEKELTYHEVGGLLHYIERLKYLSPAYNDSLCSRWAELRKSSFRLMNLDNIIGQYFELFAATGADVRETERWNGIDGIFFDFQAERNYMHQWMEERLAFLDAYYGYDPSKEDTPEDAALHESGNDKLIQVRKFLRNQSIFIERNGILYRMTGERIY